MYDPFGQDDAVIRDTPYVRVTRLGISEKRKSCCYLKVFKPEGMGTSSAYWMDRESRFLLDFQLKSLRHTAQLVSLEQIVDGDHDPVIEHVVTVDAGVSVEDWLRVAPRYADGTRASHPFQHPAVLLELLRASLAALKEIHAHGIVHCDIKPDNICLPYKPCPLAEDRMLRLDFGHLRLIDFSFSITPERALQRCPPVLPQAPYQSELYKGALRADRNSRKANGENIQKLDYRVDLYSLGYLAGRIIEDGLDADSDPALTQGARQVADRLKAFGAPKSRRPKSLPHDDLISGINALLKKAAAGPQRLAFEVAEVLQPAKPGQDQPSAPNGLDDLRKPTPIAPEDLPDPPPIAPEDQLDPPPPPRWKPWARKLALPLAVVGAVITVWPPSPSSIGNQQHPCHDYSDGQKDYTGCQFEHVDFLCSVNPEGANFKGAAGMPEWLGQGLDSAGIYRQAVLAAAIRGGFKRLQSAYLGGADLEGMDLAGADLSKAYLRKAKLRGAKVEGVQWQGTDLTGAVWTDGGYCRPGSIGKCVR